MRRNAHLLFEEAVELAFTKENTASKLRYTDLVAQMGFDIAINRIEIKTRLFSWRLKRDI